MRSRSRRDFRHRSDPVLTMDGVTGRRFMLAGLFSAKVKDPGSVMATLAGVIAAGGGEVLEVFVQRRGVSHGGRRLMDQPLSERTLMSVGKVRDIAAACAALSPDAVVFANALTDRQRHVLSSTFGCPAIAWGDIEPAPADQ